MLRFLTSIFVIICKVFCNNELNKSLFDTVVVGYTRVMRGFLVSEVHS